MARAFNAERDGSGNAWTVNDGYSSGGKVSIGLTRSLRRAVAKKKPYTQNPMG